MQQGFMSQGGMVSINQDFPMSPDMVSEVKVLTSNYAPEYGASLSGQIMAVTKSGGSEFHGAVFEYHRNDALNARQWGANQKNELRKNNFGANLGGPAKLPLLWSDRVKSYFYFNYEGYRQVGGSNQPTLSIPSLAERNGDFRDWRDASGNLIPIYDPATIRPDGSSGFIKRSIHGMRRQHAKRDLPVALQPAGAGLAAAAAAADERRPYEQLPGAGDPGHDPRQFGLLHGPLRPAGGQQRSPVRQHVAPARAGEIRVDAAAAHCQRNLFRPAELLGQPLQLRPDLLVEAAEPHVDGISEQERRLRRRQPGLRERLSQIAGVANNNVPPEINFSDGFADWGSNAGVNVGNITTRPTFIINDLVTWTHTKHTLKFGMEFRKIMGNLHGNNEEAGTFAFQRGSTGLVGVNSGAPIASFLIGAVDEGRVLYRAVNSTYPRQSAWVLHAGDTWRMNERVHPRLWPALGLLPRRPARSTTACRSSIPTARTRAPEDDSAASRSRAINGARRASARGIRKTTGYGGFAPRLGAVFALNDRTVIRSGYGIFYTQAFYPGWGGGISQDGFSNNAIVRATLGGIAPAMLLDQGFPQSTFEAPPIIRSDYRNGQSILYRPVDANERPYSHQWNVTVERELLRDLSLSVAYVGTAGRRLPSSIAPINAIDPQYLSMGGARSMISSSRACRVFTARCRIQAGSNR